MILGLEGVIFEFGEFGGCWVLLLSLVACGCDECVNGIVVCEVLFFDVVAFPVVC